MTPRLSRAVLGDTSAGTVTVPTPAMLALPERAVQFGTGAFLRGFVDWFVDVANAQGRFNGRIVCIGSTGSGRDRAFAEQDGLFTVIARGTVDGIARDERRVVGSVSRAISAATEWQSVLACARHPQLSVVFSNTTEVGIARGANDAPDAEPPESFPAKLTRFLYERARTFAFALSKGVVIVPCELIEQNGRTLQRLVLELGDEWGYGRAFAHWVEQGVHFCDTLVDRIVPGAPDDADGAAFAAELGWHDDLLTTAELFRLFVIEADASVRARLDLEGVDEGIVFTDDVGAYRERKVRLLNGAHTIAVSVALLADCATVYEATQHPLVGPFLRRVLLDEILPTVQAPDAEPFARAVLDRFANPHIRHALLDITLHGTTKLKVRVVPTILAAAKHGRIPAALVVGVAAHLARFALMDGALPRTDTGGETLRIHWQSTHGVGEQRVAQYVLHALADTTLWDANLSSIPGFVDAVSAQVDLIMTHSIASALESLLPAHSHVETFS